MSNFYTQDGFAVVTGVLAADVANSGTLVVSYPSGYTQANFLIGLDAAAYIVVGDNDIWRASASKMSVVYGASNITITNSSSTTWAAGKTFSFYANIEDGNDVVVVGIPVKLSKVTAADVVTDLQLGIAGIIESISFLVTDPVTTGAKLATFNLEIGTTDLTGGVLALTSALATPLGTVLQATAITGNNTLTAASKISLEATAVTAFVEGEGTFYLRIRRS